MPSFNWQQIAAFPTPEIEMMPNEICMEKSLKISHNCVSEVVLNTPCLCKTFSELIHLYPLTIQCVEQTKPVI